MEILRKLKGVARGWVKGIGIVAVVVGLTLIVKSTSTLFDVVLYSIPGPEATYHLKDNPPLKLSEMGTTPAGLSTAPLIALYRKNPRQPSEGFIFFCTGFVVTNTYAMTAAHCISDLEQGDLARDDIQIRSIDLKQPLILAKAAAINPRADLGIIRGDFSHFKKLSINLLGFFDSPGPFFTCGFPYGSVGVICVPFHPEGNQEFGIKGKGFLYPGMSGGPVIDGTTKKVVGLNQAVGDGSVVVVPMVGLTGALELTVQ